MEGGVGKEPGLRPPVGGTLRGPPSGRWGGWVACWQGGIYLGPCEGLLSTPELSSSLMGEQALVEGQ